MADNEDPADAALRLEEALERIARHAHRPAPSPAAAGTDTARIADRLDVLIAQLRAALGTSGAP